MPDGFERFFAAHHRRVLSVLTVVSGDVDLANEATDEAFARAFERWERVSCMADPAGWVYRVAVNTARRRARRRSREATLLGSAPRFGGGGEPPAMVEFWELVNGLPERQRVAVVLRYVGDLTEPQIAEAMGIRRSTVNATLNKALHNLRQELVSQRDEADVVLGAGRHA